MWRAPGMPGLLAMTVLVFAGFGLLLPLSPLWAVQGGADERGAGLVTATLMLFTVLAQLRVNATLARLGWGWTLALGLVLLAAPAPVQAISPDLWLVLATSAVRGLGFGILTVCGATAISLLVTPEARGRAVGAYGLVIAIPQLALTPAAPWLLATFGFPLVAAFGAVPLLAVAWMPHLGRRITASAPGGAAPQTAAERVGPSTARRIWRPLLALLLATSAGGALLTFTAQLAPDTGTAVLALVCLTAAAALCRWRIGALSDRWGTRPFVAPMLVVGAAGLVLVGLAGEPVAPGRGCARHRRGVRRPAERHADPGLRRGRRPAPGLRRLERRVRPRHRAGRRGGGRDRRAELLPRRLLRAGLRLPGRGRRHPPLTTVVSVAAGRSVVGAAGSDVDSTTVLGATALSGATVAVGTAAPTGTVSALG